MMARPWIRRRDVVALLGGGAAAWRRGIGAAIGTALLVPHAAHAESVGSVADVQGEAFAEARAERRALYQTAPLFINDVVATGRSSRLTLRLGKDTTLRLGQEARLTVDRFLVDAGGEIELQSGPILFDRPPRSNPSKMDIQSPFALISVRGTRFFAGPSAAAFGVFVQRGSVVVSGAGSRVLLRAGQGTDVKFPGAAPTPAAAWGPARINAALASVE